MQASENEVTPYAQHVRYGLSWVAYLRPISIYILLIFIGIGLGNKHLGLGATVIGLGLILLVYKVLLLRSVHIYTDEDGVWIRRGILPWNRFSNGVKWQDVDGAGCYPGFVSWACKSYAVRVGHRFTKSSEIVQPHVKDGDKVVQHINELHRNWFAG